MNREPLHNLRSEILAALRSIAASARRKRIMQEELLGHLSEIYEEEFARTGNEWSAIDAVTQRFGDARELADQLQGSVPFFERMFFACLNRKENRMLRWWIAGLVVLLITIGAMFTEDLPFVLGALTMLAGVGVYHYLQQDNPIGRWIRPRWMWIVGFLIAFFGSGIILPAMARYKQSGVLFDLVPSVVGTLLVLKGLGIIVYSLKTRRARLAS